MTLSTGVRRLFTASAFLLSVLVAANWTKLFERLGLDTVVADLLMPATGRSPLLQFLTAQAGLITTAGVLGVAVGMWLAEGVRALDQARERKEWWKDKNGLSIVNAACALKGKRPSRAPTDQDTLAIVDDIRARVDAGIYPTFGEEPDPARIASGKTLYSPKTATDTTVISKKYVEKYAKEKNIQTPWTVHDKNDTKLIKNIKY
ncbi:hypothetical protein V5F53_03065 [Xanthobacter sp. V4C-4]|uniref:hypothetical protein n=1 Tax=Xanthobacter cornucopiae TaxID=3119924 RepID=UPI003726C934